MGTQVVHSLILILVRGEVALIQILNHVLLRARVGGSLEALGCVSLVGCTTDDLSVELALFLVLCK